MWKFQWRTVTQSHTNSISAPRGQRVLSVIPKYNLQLLHWQRTWACVNFNFVWTVWEVSAGAEHCAVHFSWLQIFSVISFNLCLCLGLSWFSVFRKQWNVLGCLIHWQITKKKKKSPHISSSSSPPLPSIYKLIDTARASHRTKIQFRPCPPHTYL